MDFLSNSPGGNYVFQKMPYQEQAGRAAAVLGQADAVLIGAGAGLSAAAGLVYDGRRFEDNFGEFIAKYGRAAMRDMYSAGFYPFPTQEERWGYWSKHSCVNRIELEALPLYRLLYDMVGEMEHFVLTTNVDHQFWKAGFAGKDIFAPQGDYGLIQCARGCHLKTYDAAELFVRMDKARRDCAVPSQMVPRCPVCNGPMTMNLRCDRYFVEDEHWNQAAERFGTFLKQAAGKRLVLLELGVGFNTPAIIRFPFEKMMREHENWRLVRLNLDQAMVPERLGNRAIGINGDITKSLSEIAARTAQARRRVYLICAMRKEMPQYGDVLIPEDGPEQKDLLRSLMNARPPIPAQPGFLDAQDAYLSEEIKRRGIVDCRLLADCYQSCLELAVEHDVHSIALCCISTGVFRFPRDKAAEIAVETVTRFLKQNPSIDKVVFNVFTDKDRMIYQRLLEKDYFKI